MKKIGVFVILIIILVGSVIALGPVKPFVPKPGGGSGSAFNPPSCSTNTCGKCGDDSLLSPLQKAYCTVFKSKSVCIPQLNNKGYYTGGCRLCTFGSYDYGGIQLCSPDPNAYKKLKDCRLRGCVAFAKIAAEGYNLGYSRGYYDGSGGENVNENDLLEFEGYSKDNSKPPTPKGTPYDSIGKEELGSFSFWSWVKKIFN